MNPEDIESLVTLIMHGPEEAIVVAGGAEEVGEKLYKAGVFKPLMKSDKESREEQNETVSNFTNTHVVCNCNPNNRNSF